MYDYADLRGKIRARFRKQENFAKALPLSPCALSKKLNNRSEWTHTEIVRTCELLGLPLEEVHAYFFTPLVEKTQQKEVQQHG